MIDTVIIGAGPSGLCAAKTILQCDPTAEIKVVDVSSTLGGVWAKEKIYPTLKTNHYFGGLDFSDFPMPVGHGAQPRDHIPGIAIHEYLKTYAKRFGLEKFIQFNTKVEEVMRIEGGQGWRLRLSSPGESFLECKKLIVGMGLNNKPHRPRFEGGSQFEAPIIHSGELGEHATSATSDATIKKVAVLGAGKSAYDTVYMAAAAGKEVEWIIRKSGKGPVWVFPMEAKLGPFTILREKMGVRRITSLFSPCIWNDGFKFIRSFLHRTKIGQFITNFFWTQMCTSMLEDCGYRKHERLKVLEPEHSSFWYGTTGGSCKYLPELWDYIIKGTVRVHRQDITHLSPRTIHLANGQELNVDAFVTATGFSAKPNMKFSPASDHCDLGLPSTEYNIDQQKFWASLDLQSDYAIAKRLPSLFDGPNKKTAVVPPSPSDPRNDPEANYSPFRLYRAIVPPGLTAEGDRSLVFLGAFSNFANMTRLEVQALWAYAYLNNKLTIDPKTVYSEASMVSRYNKHRTPMGHGKYFPDHVPDQLPYLDTLLRDLGVSTRRKANLFREIFEAYSVTDYKGIISEWLATQQKA